MKFRLSSNCKKMWRLKMAIKQITAMAQVDAQAWNSLVGDGCPFLRHEFLLALEQTGCVSAKTGWKPKHLLMLERNRLVGAMPLYLKNHSRGEYVFDSQWAHAASHYGQDYYPKWLTAIPFTPCQGRRVLVKKGRNAIKILALFIEFIKDKSAQESITSWHCLFPQTQQLQDLRQLGLAIREGVQFHWTNKGYHSFDDFLAEFNTSKRKMVKRERRKVSEQGIELIQLHGNEVTAQQWAIFFDFYRMTYFKHGMPPYLNLDFFLACAVSMGKDMLLVFAKKDEAYVGAALSFIGNDTLYGRYWGCLEEYNALHFEACYYQGLDYCIANGIKYFDSGAQGEHKIGRGFEPVTTYSAHWFCDVNFAQAIQHFLHRERLAVANYKQEAASYLPFKKNGAN